MKCPKCEYLGFDTGDRCRNCGYDFSLLAAAEADPVADLTLRADGDDFLGGNLAGGNLAGGNLAGGDLAGGDWLADLDTVLQDKAGVEVAPLSITPDLMLPSLTPTDLAPPATAAPEPDPEPDAVEEPEPIDEPEAIDDPEPAIAATPAAAAAPALTIVPASAPAVAAAAAPALAVAAAALDFEPPMPPPSFRGEAALPLFSGDPAKDDEPLIKVPSAPRAPLAVRRTPETPRLRAVPRLVERPVPEPEPELDFAAEASGPNVAARVAKHQDSQPLSSLETTAAGPRLTAALIDHAILFAIDATVLYLTLRIAQLTLSDIRALPLVPMATFLALLKLAYFTAFTCVGGQTIGKMAMGIRVVGDEQRSLDAPHAIHRALAGAVSYLTLGLGFLPALFGSERRALHDRLAHTRVVTLPRA